HRSSAATGDEHWDGQFLPPGNCEWVYRLAADGNLLYVSGLESMASDTNFNVCNWDGAKWSEMGSASGNTPFVFAFAFVGNAMYAGGRFSGIGGAQPSGLARRDGTNWSGVGGFDGTTYSMAVDGTNLYVGGSFTNIGEMPIRFIARWDGMNWSGLGAG